MMISSNQKQFLHEPGIRKRRSNPTTPAITIRPAVPASGLITAGTTRSIVGIREDAAFRTNLMLANAGTSPVRVDLILLSASGATLGARSWDLLPLGMRQIGPLVGEMGVSGAVRDAQLLLTTSTSGGAFAAYASVIDNTTNDPRTLLPN